MLKGDEVGLDTHWWEIKQPLLVEHSAVLLFGHLGWEHTLHLSLTASSPFSLKMSLMRTLFVSAAMTLESGQAFS